MSWAFLLNLIFSGMFCPLVGGIETIVDARSEYRQGVKQHPGHPYVQCSCSSERRKNKNNLEPSHQVLHEKYKDDFRERNQKNQRKQFRRRSFRRGTLTKFINEWILFIFILHCLFVGALLEHIGTHWNIQFTSAP